MQVHWLDHLLCSQHQRYLSPQAYHLLHSWLTLSALIPFSLILQVVNHHRNTPKGQTANKLYGSKSFPHLQVLSEKASKGTGRSILNCMMMQSSNYRKMSFFSLSIRFFFMVCLDLVHLKDLNSSLVCFSKVLQDPFLGPINIIEVGPGEVSTFGAGQCEVGSASTRLFIFRII